MAYYDDIGIDFEIENRIKDIGSCSDFTDMDEDMFDYIDDYRGGRNVRNYN